MQRSGPGRAGSALLSVVVVGRRSAAWVVTRRGTNLHEVVSRRRGHVQFCGSPRGFTISPVIKGNQPRNYQSAN